MDGGELFCHGKVVIRKAYYQATLSRKSCKLLVFESPEIIKIHFDKWVPKLNIKLIIGFIHFEEFSMQGDLWSADRYSLKRAM